MQTAWGTQCRKMAPFETGNKSWGNEGGKRYFVLKLIGILGRRSKTFVESGFTLSIVEFENMGSVKTNLGIKEK